MGATANRDDKFVDPKLAFDAMGKEVAYMVNDLRRIAKSYDTDKPLKKMLGVAACLLEDLERERVVLNIQLDDVVECECGELVRKNPPLPINEEVK